MTAINRGKPMDQSSLGQLPTNIRMVDLDLTFDTYSVPWGSHAINGSQNRRANSTTQASGHSRHDLLIQKLLLKRRREHALASIEERRNFTSLCSLEKNRYLHDKSNSITWGDA